MHELSIALDIVDLACDEAGRRGAARVDAVHLRVGQLSGVVREALVFSFEAAAAGTAAAGARLQIEEVAVTVWCGACSAERPLATVARRRCPVCDGVTPQIVHGEELELVALEIPEP